MRGMFLTIALCAALAIAGCGGGSSSSSTGSTGASSEANTAKAPEPKLPQDKPKVEKQSGTPPKRLESKDLVEGSGAVAKAGEEVTVQYVGVNYKTGKEFDSSWSRNEPFTFTLGAGEVIAGWDQGLPGMKVGGRRQLIIPPALGYGPSGYPPAIPPNETLIFVIDLLAAK